jgi:hypothetical protein
MQSDYALSVADYLGIGSAAPEFVGRSLFRAYPTQRNIYFANTYQRRDWELTTDGILSRCTEQLTGCLSYQVTPANEPFSPQRVPAPWTAARLREWGAAITYSVRPIDRVPHPAAQLELPASSSAPPAPPHAAQPVANASPPPLAEPVHYPLAPTGRFHVDPCLKLEGRGGASGKGCGGGALVYGPYAWAPAGGTVAAQFKVRVSGGGPAKLRLQLTENRANHELATTKEITVAPGGHATLETQFVATKDMGGLEARLLYSVAKPVRVKITSGELVVEPAKAQRLAASASAAPSKL